MKKTNERTIDPFVDQSKSNTQYMSKSIDFNRTFIVTHRFRQTNKQTNKQTIRDHVRHLFYRINHDIDLTREYT
jgi:hypothetical protein